MAAYEAKFSELSRFAPHMIATEAMKAKKFERGLRPYLRSHVSMFRHETYAEVYDKAELAETNSDDYFRRRDSSQGRSMSRGQASGSAPAEKRARTTSYQPTGPTSSQRPPVVPQASRPTVSQAPRPATSQTTRFAPSAPTVPFGLCSYCGKKHPVGECRRLSGGCFHCGNQGHQIRDCPKKQAQGGMPPVRQPLQQGSSQASRPSQPAQPPRQANQGKVFALTEQDAHASDDVVQGTSSQSFITAWY